MVSDIYLRGASTVDEACSRFSCATANFGIMVLRLENLTLVDTCRLSEIIDNFGEHVDRLTAALARVAQQDSAPLS